MAYTVTVYQLCEALLVQEQTIKKREREGTMPPPILESPRTYDLFEVLKSLDADDRAALAKRLELKLYITLKSVGPEVQREPGRPDKDAVMF